MHEPAPVVARTDAGAWLVVAALWVVMILNYIDRVMITTMRGSLTAVIPMTDAEFGLLTAVFLWVYGLTSPVMGFLADRFSRGRLIIGSLVVWSLLTWLTGQARSFEQLLVVRALMGISEATYMPAALALIADHHRTGTRSLATGIHMTGTSVGTGLAGVAGWLAERQGPTAAFSLFGFIGIAYALVLTRLLPAAPAEARATAGDPPRLWAALGSLVGNPAFLLLLGFWGLLGITGWALLGWLPTHFQDRFAMGQGAAGLSATGILAAAMLVGKLLGGAWADRWGRTNERAVILVPAVGMFLSAPAVAALAGAESLTVAAVGLVVYGLARPFVDANSMPIVCLIVDARYRATAYGMINLVSCLAGGAAIYVGGVLRDWQADVGALFLVAAGCLVACGLILLAMLPWVGRSPGRG